MTKEEILEILEHNWTCLKNHAYTDNELDEALEFIIKALTDVHDNNVGKMDIAYGDRAVSLNDAIKATCKVCGVMSENKQGIKCQYYEDECREVESLKQLPSVTLQRPKGHWIDCCERNPYYRCSECRERVFGSYRKFCPNCGAEMKDKEI